MNVDAVVPAVFDCGTVEGVERAAAAGVDGIEFFDPQREDREAVLGAVEAADLEVAGTLAVGAGANIDERDRGFIADPDSHDDAVEDLTRSVEIADEVGARSLVSTVGPELQGVAADAQHRAIVDVLRSVAPTAEQLGVTVVVEPLNTRVDHPGYYLTDSAEAYELVEAVDSPAVKLLFDVYHQQITEGDVIRNLRNHLPSVGHVHIADNPGRNEPGTGELAYERVLGALADAGYDGYVGCEFTPTGDPEGALADVVAMAERSR
jgi:hydroxypyruvate isomerase